MRLPNLLCLHGYLPTMGGAQFWADSAVCGGWRVQRHAYFKISRLLNPQNRLITLGSYEQCHQRFNYLKIEGTAVWPQDRSIVFIIHGYGGLPSRFKPLSNALEAAGFTPVILTYPGLLQGVEQAADHLTTILNSLTLPYAIIAGIKGDGRGYNPWISGEDDGLISLDEAYLPQADIIYPIKENHWSILRSRTAFNVTIDYLQK